MATKIEWTDETWNPLRARRVTDGKIGWHCELASPGCQNCYAQRFNGRELPNGGTGLPYTRGSRENVQTFIDDETLRQPLRWKRSRMIFVCSMTDLFGEWVTDEQIDRVFAVMNACMFTLPISDRSKPWHTFQVLTKRADRMRDYMKSRSGCFRQGDHPVFKVRGDVFRGCGPEAMNAGGVLRWPPPNVWLGVSAEDQDWADKRITQLEATPAFLRFVSAEPLLGPIDLKRFHSINWVIAGGESGPNARPMHPQWVRDVRDDCQGSNIRFFFKQWGEWGSGLWNLNDDLPAMPRQFTTHQQWVAKAPSWVNGGRCVDMQGRTLQNGADFANAEFPVAILNRCGKKRSGRMLDGREWNEFPEVAHA